MSPLKIQILHQERILQQYAYLQFRPFSSISPVFILEKDIYPVFCPLFLQYSIYHGNPDISAVFLPLNPGISAVFLSLDPNISAVFLTLDPDISAVFLPLDPDIPAVFLPLNPDIPEVPEDPGVEEEKEEEGDENHAHKSAQERKL